MTQDQIAKARASCLARLGVERAAAAASLDGSLPAGDSLAGFDLATQYVFKQQLAGRLRRIERAQERDRQGQYGRCERCGQPMWERLLVLPYAELCIDCQRKTERSVLAAAGSSWLAA
jgi:RNA polymerase-binding transcription factor DksA